jgi:TonB-dependent Receptor Plug Domain
LISNQNLLLTIRDKGGIANDESYLLQTDTLGNFSMENLLVNDSSLCIVKLSNYKREYTAKITIDTTPSVFPHFFKDSKAEDFYAGKIVNPSLSNGFTFKDKTIALDTFLVKETRSRIPKRDAKQVFYDKPNASVKIDQSKSAANTNLVEYLNGREGLKLQAEGLSGDVKIRSLRGPTSFQPQNSSGMPMIFIDGFQTNVQTLAMIPLSEVEKVDIIRSANALYGAQGANGVINVITKTGKGVAGVKTDDGETAKLPQVPVKGFSIVREFYSPDYSDKKSDNTTIDHRTSLYWTNTAKTGENGNASIIFYNSDVCKKGRIIIQCIDKKGRIGYLMASYGR